MLTTIKKLAGAPLTATDGRKIGTISDVIIDRDSGALLYVLMDVSSDEVGIADPGKMSYPLPWQLISYNTSKRTFQLDIESDHLKRAPSIKSSTPPLDWEDRVWAERLHEHYGLQPYWTVRSSR